MPLYTGSNTSRETNDINKVAGTVNTFTAAKNMPRVKGVPNSTTASSSSNSATLKTAGSYDDEAIKVEISKSKADNIVRNAGVIGGTLVGAPMVGKDLSNIYNAYSDLNAARAERKRMFKDYKQVRKRLRESERYLKKMNRLMPIIQNGINKADTPHKLNRVSRLVGTLENYRDKYRDVVPDMSTRVSTYLNLNTARNNHRARKADLKHAIKSGTRGIAKTLGLGALGAAAWTAGFDYYNQHTPEKTANDITATPEDTLTLSIHPRDIAGKVALIAGMGTLGEASNYIDSKRMSGLPANKNALKRAVVLGGATLGLGGYAFRPKAKEKVASDNSLETARNNLLGASALSFGAAGAGAAIDKAIDKFNVRATRDLMYSNRDMLRAIRKSALAATSPEDKRWLLNYMHNVYSEERAARYELKDAIRKARRAPYKRPMAIIPAALGVASLTGAGLLQSDINKYKIPENSDN